MEAMTSAGVVTSVRIISRVCGRTRRILRSRLTSSLPEVFSLVNTRSKGLASAKASAARLSGACWMLQLPGFSVLVSTASTWGSASTTSAAFAGDCGIEGLRIASIDGHLHGSNAGGPYPSRWNRHSEFQRYRDRVWHFRSHFLVIRILHFHV